MASEWGFLLLQCYCESIDLAAINLQDLLPLLESSGYSGNLSLNSEKTFSENSIDSLDVFSWLAAIEEKYGVSVSDEEFPLIKTPADLVNFIMIKLSLRKEKNVAIVSRSYQKNDWLAINDLYKRVTGRSRSQL